MNELNFRNWMIALGKNKKVTSDTVSRLKRIEKEIGPCDIDNEYQKDRCEKLLELFYKNGDNEAMKSYKTSLPVGKYHMSTYRLAIRQYVKFCDEVS